ncbi:MAG: hypothetical protein V4773_27630 [Verrucomicrobiota bacterium]
MTQQDLRLILFAAGLPAALWQLPDFHYDTCSELFVARNWDAWLEARPVELAVLGEIAGKRVRQRPKWIEETSDCDNLAIGTMAWAQVGNALAGAQRGTARGGLAYGVIFFTAGPARPENFNVTGGHAINWFVDHANTVKFFEPGVGQLVDLNTAERSSAWFGLAA